MEIDYEKISPTVMVVSFAGALNASSAQEAKDCFRNLVEDGVTHVIVELREVPFIESWGLASLVYGLKTFHTRIKLVAPQSQPWLLFQITLFDRVFEIYDHIFASIEAIFILKCKNQIKQRRFLFILRVFETNKPRFDADFEC